MGSQAQTLDRIFQRVFAVTLDASRADSTAVPPVAYLKELEQELRDEGASNNGTLLIDRNNLDRVLMARLMNEQLSESIWPVPYLLGCYLRASEEIRQSETFKDKGFAEEVKSCLTFCKELVVNYCGLIITMDLFPQPPEAKERGALQLLDSLEGVDSTPMPVGFLEDFCARFREEGLDDVIVEVAKELCRKVLRVSLFGDFSKYVSVFQRLLSIRAAAEVLLAPPLFQPSAENGREFQEKSLLGPFFSVTALPDGLQQLPNVYADCFSNVESRRPGDVAHSMAAIRATGRQLQGELGALVLNLLRGKDTRELTLQWLAGALETNNERAKMQMNSASAATDGFMINLSSVLMKLCDPFVEPGTGKAWGKIDVNYVTDPASRLDMWRNGDETKLAASKDEEEAWVEERGRVCSAGSSSKDSYSFICECFFMTAKGLHLGLVKTINMCMEKLQRLHSMQRHLVDAESATQRLEGRQGEAARQQLQRYKETVEHTKGTLMCYDAVLHDDQLLSAALAYYRLMAAWLLREASPEVAAGQAPRLPLPSPTPMTFRTLPEYYVEDLADLLLYVGRVAPQLLDVARSQEFLTFLTVFIGSPNYIRNPYLRFKLVEVLHLQLPPDGDTDFRPGGRRRVHAATTALAHILATDRLAQDYLVPSVLALYADIEFIDRAGQFYEKFQMRHTMGQLLSYLWQLPAHRGAWRLCAAQQGGRGVYLQFANMLVNDSIYLLDESLKKLPDIRDAEQLMADTVRWQALSPQEQGDQESRLRSSAGQVRSWLYYAVAYVGTLQYSTTEAECTLAFLLPEMVERIAAMLNYFLMYLTGPERRKLRVRDPAQYNWDPKVLLTQIALIYLHLAARDSAGSFAAAIASDKRSYRPEMFTEAAQVLQQFALLSDVQLDALSTLATRVTCAAGAEAAEEELAEGAPEEFLDPIQYTIMRDPVIMPTSNTTIDRATILRHLLSDPRDPISRQHLDADMLQPNVALKQRIEEWLAQQRANRMQEQ